MNYELTIGGHTRQSSKEMANAYEALSESFGLIGELSTTTARATREMSKLGSEIAELNHRIRQAKQESDQLRQENEALKNASKADKSDCSVPEPGEPD